MAHTNDSNKALDELGWGLAGGIEDEDAASKAREHQAVYDDRGADNAELGHQIQDGGELAYALAGKAKVTLVSRASGARFTFQIKKAKEDPRWPGASWFVALLSGPDNQSDYNYLGLIKEAPGGPRFRLTAKSRAGLDAPSVKAITFFLRHPEHEQLEVWHSGTCGRCGRELTVPSSIESGLGPVCAGRE